MISLLRLCLRKYFAVMVGLAMILVCICCGAARANASQGALISVLAPRGVYVGDTFDVTISLAEMIPACMLQFTVTYDSKCFEVMGVSAGSVFDGVGPPTLNSSQPGEAILCWDSITPLSSEGILLTIKLKSKSVTDKTVITVSDKHEFIICDESFTAIAVARKNAQMAVVDTAFRIGDVNRDKEINTGDAVMVLRSAVGICALSDTQTFLGDYNKDSLINTGDAVAILRYCVFG